VRTFRLLAVLLGVTAFLLGLRIFGRSYSTTRWPVTPGRIISSGRGTDPSSRLETRVEYEYLLAGKVYRARGIHDPQDTTYLAGSQAEAESLLQRFPPGSEVLVGFDPGDPAQAVLLPRLKWWSLVLTVAGAGLMTLGMLLGREARQAPLPTYAP
jgi:hypothetical protein